MVTNDTADALALAVPSCSVLSSRRGPASAFTDDAADKGSRRLSASVFTDDAGNACMPAAVSEVLVSKGALGGCTPVVTNDAAPCTREGCASMFTDDAAPSIAGCSLSIPAAAPEGVWQAGGDITCVLSVRVSCSTPCRGLGTAAATCGKGEARRGPVMDTSEGVPPSCAHVFTIDAGGREALGHASVIADDTAGSSRGEGPGSYSSAPYQWCCQCRCCTCSLI